MSFTDRNTGKKKTVRDILNEWMGVLDTEKRDDGIMLIKIGSVLVPADAVHAGAPINGSPPVFIMSLKIMALAKVLKQIMKLPAEETAAMLREEDISREELDHLCNDCANKDECEGREPGAKRPRFKPITEPPKTAGEN